MRLKWLASKQFFVFLFVGLFFKGKINVVLKFKDGLLDQQLDQVQIAEPIKGLRATRSHLLVTRALLRPGRAGPSEMYDANHSRLERSK